MTDEATPGKSESGEPETPATPETPDAPESPAADAPAAAESTATESSATEPSAAEPEAAVPARREEGAVPAAVEMGPAADPRAEARKTRIVLPFLLPIAAIGVVAFYSFNISRIFIAAAESDTTAAVIIAAGITLSILIGATVIAALPDIRTSSLVVGLSGVMLVVMLAGSLVLGTSQPKTEAAAGYVEPAGKAINTLEIDALPELKFQATKFNVPGGINLVKYVDKGGTHTLVFDNNKVPGFELQVPNGQSAAKVDLTAGQTYTVYCTIPGHRAAGMQADIIVGPNGGAPEPGTQSPTQTTGPGTTQTTVAPGTSNTDKASQASTGS